MHAVIKIWNATTGATIWTITSAVDALTASFSTDGNKIVSSSGGYAVTVWSNNK